MAFIERANKISEYYKDLNYKIKYDGLSSNEIAAVDERVQVAKDALSRGDLFCQVDAYAKLRKDHKVYAI